MTDSELIIECARLDGWIEPHLIAFTVRGYKQQPKEYPINSTDISYLVPNYLTSRDVIIPVIEKHIRDFSAKRESKFLTEIEFELGQDTKGLHKEISILCAYPRQLAVALVKAVGKWKE